MQTSKRLILSVLLAQGSVTMKKLGRSLLIPGWILILLFAGMPANAETVKITTGEWKPFISEEFKHGGVILHIVREAFARKEIDVKIGFFPWARAVK